ncbi:DGQHR domain-containing protein [Bradyrhizobium sp. CIR18]|uniref:DGQHR domain-containing protein n=1 Tax=Bradyrhizobium sp. CIR18 TaxID=2663839 RepID=UPI0016064463|nr:DGQHR domain-containing protein [Bradyrhizobium sp. CIR18]MBB4363477.1 DGQHR domain-containing protein [Bradyrhizobium sp. CIR18]
MARPAKVTGKQSRRLATALQVKAIGFEQNDVQLCAFAMEASVLWSFVSINRMIEDKEQGYQRTLSGSRVKAVADYIEAGHPITTSILISLPKATYSAKTEKLSIPAGKDVGWVIDGQHRLAGAHLAAENGQDIPLSVVAVLGQEVEFEIEQFITVNREAKGVPTAIVYELLKHLPSRKKPSDVAAEIAAELGSALRKDPDSVFSNRIVVTTSPGPGQVSLTNFVRKVSPLVHPERGLLNIYTFEEQKAILENYFRALKVVFPGEWSKAKPIFFQTVGFGALFNVFDYVFKETFQRSKASFAVEDIVKVFRPIAHFEFASWNSYGSGSKAEIEAGNDLRVDLQRSLTAGADKARIRLA